MKKQILFLHSAGPQGRHEGSGDLVAALKASLGADYKVLYPKMPHPEAPDYAPWKKKLGKVLEGLEGKTLVVGHSLGGSVLLKYLSEEKVSLPISGLFLVATPYWGSKGWEYEPFYLAKDFADKLPRIPSIYLYHSRKDEVVDFSHLARYAKKLPKATIRKLPGTEHAFTNGLNELAEDIRNH